MTKTSITIAQAATGAVLLCTLVATAFAWHSQNPHRGAYTTSQQGEFQKRIDQNFENQNRRLQKLEAGLDKLTDKIDNRTKDILDAIRDRR